jgi:hypothetical protein
MKEDISDNQSDEEYTNFKQSFNPFNFKKDTP